LRSASLPRIAACGKKTHNERSPERIGLGATEFWSGKEGVGRGGWKKTQDDGGRILLDCLTEVDSVSSEEESGNDLHDSVSAKANPGIFKEGGGREKKTAGKMERVE